MSLSDRLNVRPRSRECIEARVLQLLMDTCYHHAEACVHRVAASPSAGPGIQGRDLDDVIVRRDTSPMKQRLAETGLVHACPRACSP